MSDIETINTPNIDECPSILDILGFLKFPNIKPLSLSENEQELGSLSSELFQGPVESSDSNATLSSEEPEETKLQDKFFDSNATLSSADSNATLTSDSSVFSLKGAGYKSKSKPLSKRRSPSSKKPLNKRRSPSSKKPLNKRRSPSSKKPLNKRRSPSSKRRSSSKKKF